ncbi:MAG: hypothetical protein AAF655_21200 [Bacteroidota bacterium]
MKKHSSALVEGWFGILGKDITTNKLARLSHQIYQWLSAQHEVPAVMIGFDNRFLNDFLAKDMANTLAFLGAEVFLSPTYATAPMVSMATHKRQAHIGIYLSGANLPAIYTGTLLKSPMGGNLSMAEWASIISDTTIEYEEKEDQFDAWIEKRTIEFYDMDALYVNHLRESIEHKDIKSKGIIPVLDAAYGTGQRILKKLLPKTHLLHTGSLPKSFDYEAYEAEEAPAVLSATVTGKGASLGIGLDLTGKYLRMVDENGKVLSKTEIAALYLHHMSQVENRKATVMGNETLAPGLSSFADKLGLPFTQNLYEEMEVDPLLVIHPSGEMTVVDHIPEPDALYMACKIMEGMAVLNAPLSKWVSTLGL